MERVKLNAEAVEKAETYIPLDRKCAIAQVLAPGCIEKISTSPPMWQPSVIGRELVSMYILAGFYLHLIDTSGLDKPETEFIFTLEDYERFRGLERELLNMGEQKARDILADYADLMGFLRQEVDNLLAQRNDPLERLGQALAVSLTPEVMQTIQEAAKAAQGGEEK